MSERTWTTDEVAEFYDGSSPMADKYFFGFQHLGYWFDDNDDTPLDEAEKRLTRKLVDTLGLRAGETLLDAGCGTGAPAVQIAGEYGVEVTALTISQVEAETARRRVGESDVSGQVKVEIGDYHALPYPENSFDAVVAIESLFNSFDLAKALLEFHRVLRPGGRIAASEMVKASETAEAKEPFPTSRSSMATSEWVKEFEAAGFVIEETTQCGRRVFLHSGKHMLKRHDEVSGELREQFGEETVAEIRAGMKGAFDLGPENVGYMILCARKQ